MIAHSSNAPTVAIIINFHFFARIEQIMLSTYIPKIISNFIIDMFNDSKTKPVNGIKKNNSIVPINIEVNELDKQAIVDALVKCEKNIFRQYVLK